MARHSRRAHIREWSRRFAAPAVANAARARATGRYFLAVASCYRRRRKSLPPRNMARRCVGAITRSRAHQVCDAERKQKSISELVQRASTWVVDAHRHSASRLDQLCALTQRPESRLGLFNSAPLGPPQRSMAPSLPRSYPGQWRNERSFRRRASPRPPRSPP